MPAMNPMKRYPRAHENKVSVAHPSFRASRKPFLKAALTNFALLQILFLCLFAYIFGSIFDQSSHYNKLRVLFVDYDGGLVGESVRSSYKPLQGHGFPTLLEHSPSEFAGPEDLRKQVCGAHYWAALYTSPGASKRLETALLGHSTAYNKADVLSYIWNEAAYPTVLDAAISANLQTLSSAARIRYAAANWTDTVDSPNGETIAVLADPWHLTSVNIQPTTQGARTIYSTIVIVLILIQEFFYLGTINNLYEGFKIYSRLNPHRIIFFRNLLSASYTLIGSLCTTGMIWAFRYNWVVNGNQFALTWAVFWLFAHVNFLTLDVFTVWLPPPYVPMALITWAVFNVSSIIVPFALSSAFYRWAYVIPAHEAYQVLVDIWSGGCNPQLRYALPVLFALELSGLFLGALGVYRRCHYAVIKEEKEQQALQLRIDTAVAFERDRDEKRRKERAEQALATPESDIQADKTEEAEERDREDLERVISAEADKEQMMHTNTNRSMPFGPSFGFNFGCDSSA